jgi:hypothetical protein
MDYSTTPNLIFETKGVFGSIGHNLVILKLVYLRG